MIYQFRHWSGLHFIHSSKKKNSITTFCNQLISCLENYSYNYNYNSIYIYGNTYIYIYGIKTNRKQSQYKEIPTNHKQSYPVIQLAPLYYISCTVYFWPVLDVWMENTELFYAPTTYSEGHLREQWTVV
jgi:hypothetical protein